MLQLDSSWVSSLRDVPVKRWQVVTAVTIGTLFSLNLVGKIVRNTVFVPGLTILNDLPKVGTKRKDGKRKETVVICGGR